MVLTIEELENGREEKEKQNNQAKFESVLVIQQATTHQRITAICAHLSPILHKSIHFMQVGSQVIAVSGKSGIFNTSKRAHHLHSQP